MNLKFLNVLIISAPFIIASDQFLFDVGGNPCNKKTLKPITNERALDVAKTSTLSASAPLYVDKKTLEIARSSQLSPIAQPFVPGVQRSPIDDDGIRQDSSSSGCFREFSPIATGKVPEGIPTLDLTKIPPPSQGPKIRSFKEVVAAKKTSEDQLVQHQFDDDDDEPLGNALREERRLLKNNFLDMCCVVLPPSGQTSVISVQSPQSGQTSVISAQSVGWKRPPLAPIKK